MILLLLSAAPLEQLVSFIQSKEFFSVFNNNHYGVHLCISIEGKWVQGIVEIEYCLNYFEVVKGKVFSRDIVRMNERRTEIATSPD